MSFYKAYITLCVFGLRLVKKRKGICVGKTLYHIFTYNYDEYILKKYIAFEFCLRWYQFFAKAK